MNIDNDQEFKLVIESSHHHLSNMTYQRFIFRPNASNTSAIVVKWQQENNEWNVTLEHIIATKEMYLYEWIPWLFDKITNITSRINNVWKATSKIIVGSFVQLINGTEIDMASRFVAVVADEEQIAAFDFDKYLNTKFKFLDTDILLMGSSVSPSRNREALVSYDDAEGIYLTKYRKENMLTIQKIMLINHCQFVNSLLSYFKCKDIF